MRGRICRDCRRRPRRLSAERNGFFSFGLGIFSGWLRCAALAQGGLPAARERRGFFRHLAAVTGYDPGAGYAVSNNKIYYATSYADDGVNWSTPRLLIDNAWLRLSMATAAWFCMQRPMAPATRISCRAITGAGRRHRSNRIFISGHWLLFCGPIHPTARTLLPGSDRWRAGSTFPVSHLRLKPPILPANPEATHGSL
jgi:hypothetical protein